VIFSGLLLVFWIWLGWQPNSPAKTCPLAFGFVFLSVKLSFLSMKMELEVTPVV
jgi:hypothetical protein